MTADVHRVEHSIIYHGERLRETYRPASKEGRARAHILAGRHVHPVQHIEHIEHSAERPPSRHDHSSFTGSPSEAQHLVVPSPASQSRASETHRQRNQPWQMHLGLVSHGTVLYRMDRAWRNRQTRIDLIP